MKHIACVVALSLVAGTAVAQTTTVPPQGASGDRAPTPNQRSSGTANVINPPNPDPGMAITPPAAGITPVVPPPGTGGNSPAVVPK